MFCLNGIELAKRAKAFFLEKYKNYKYSSRVLDEYKEVFIIEDTLVLYIEIDPTCKYMFDMSEQYVERGVCYLIIEEITHNEIYPNFNFSAFMREYGDKYKFDDCSPFIKYIRFRGFDILPSYTSLFDGKTTAQHLDEEYPDLQIRKRYELWKGIMHHYIVLRIKSAEGAFGYLVLVEKKDIRGAIVRFCNLLLEYSSRHFVYERFPGANIIHNDDLFVEAFASWKNSRKKDRLNNYLEYIVIDKEIKEEYKVALIAQEILSDIDIGKYSESEWILYSHPENRWKSEELCYKTVKRLYSDCGVIYQHRPLYLRSSVGGQMSYDIYISKLNLAIEYQGRQHFEAIDYFGGEEAFMALKRRDLEKKEISECHGVKLIYINYWEEITPELIKRRIDEALY